MPVLQYTRAWIKQHPIAATVAASLVLHGIVFAVIGTQTLGGGSSNTEYVMIDLIEPDIPAEKGNRRAETEINQADRQGGSGKRGVEQTGGHRSWQT